MKELQLTKTLKIVNGMNDDVAFQLTCKILRKVANKKGRGIVGEIKVVDFDYRAIYLSFNGDDCERLYIRTWDCYANGSVRYTLFDEEQRENGKFKMTDEGIVKYVSK